MEDLRYVLVSVRVQEDRDPNDFLDKLEFKDVNS